MVNFTAEFVNKARFLAAYGDQEESVSSAGDANVTEHARALNLQTRLLFVLHIFARQAGKVAFGEAHQKNDGKFQPLGRVDGQDFDLLFENVKIVVARQGGAQTLADQDILA